MPRIPSTSARNDTTLAARIAAGDEQALGVLYDQLGALAYSLAVAVLRDTGDAEEAVGDAFAQVWRMIAKFDAERGSLEGWVLTVVRSRALDRLRTRRRKERVVEIEDPSARVITDAAADPAEAPDERVVGGERRTQVAAALAHLSSAQREALQLAYFEGLTQSEIAERLQEPLGTVKTRIRAALTALRAICEPMRDRGEL